MIVMMPSSFRKLLPSRKLVSQVMTLISGAMSIASAGPKLSPQRSIVLPWSLAFLSSCSSVSSSFLSSSSSVRPPSVKPHRVVSLACSCLTFRSAAAAAVSKLLLSRLTTVSEVFSARPAASPLPSAALSEQFPKLSSLSEEFVLRAAPNASPLPRMLLMSRFKLDSEDVTAMPVASPLPSSVSRKQLTMLSSFSDEFILRASPNASPLPWMLL
mmetsp:Transcript_72575/g.121088  ORF Transcript_72575/g.121088 Transcript_72575/m.121088 type:complete len:214 (-) Transcript_72575:251-892(-)